jgi:HEAT repeat protein
MPLSYGSDMDGSACEAIRQIGTNALPWAVKWISYSGSDFPPNSLIGKISGKLPTWLKPASDKPDPNKRKANAALRVFEVLGARASPAVPDLQKLLNSQSAGESSVRAIAALAHIGKDAIPVLASHLAQTNAPARHIILFVFEYFPSLRDCEKETVSLTVSRLQDPQSYVRMAAVSALLRMRPEALTNSGVSLPPEYSLCLSQMLYMRTTILESANSRQSGLIPSDAESRKQAAVELGRLGNLALPAVPALVKRLTDPSIEVRIAASNALLQIAPEVLTNAPPK